MPRSFDRPVERTRRERVTSALAFAAGLALLPLAGGVPSTASAEPGVNGEVTGELFNCAPGPWGDVEYYEIVLETPDYNLDIGRFHEESINWYFTGPFEAAEATLLEAGLSAADTSRLIASAEWTDDIFLGGRKVKLTPWPELILDMDPDVRIRLYRQLASSRMNRFHSGPFSLETADINRWASLSDLDSQSLDLIGRLVYYEGETLVFSDLPLILSLTPDADEKKAVVKALTRTRSLLLRLKITPETDVQKVAQYWTAGFKHKDIIPILEGVARTEGVDWLDVAHLLPPIPRQYLYTYGTLDTQVNWIFPDCLWTSINFFERTPTQRVLDRRPVSHYLGKLHQRVEPPYEFGDILVIADPEQDRFIHSATYVCDDIVFTKNGHSMLHPWMFMRWEDMMSRYRKQTNFVVHGYRLVGNNQLP